MNDENLTGKNAPETETFINEWLNDVAFDSESAVFNGSMLATPLYSPEAGQFHELKDWDWITNAELLRDEGNVAGRIQAPWQEKTRTIYLHFFQKAEEERSKRVLLESEIAGKRADLRREEDHLRKLEGDYQGLGGKGNSWLPYIWSQILYYSLITANLALLIGLIIFSFLSHYFLELIGAADSYEFGFIDLFQFVAIAGLSYSLYWLIKKYTGKSQTVVYRPFLMKKEKMLRKQINLSYSRQSTLVEEINNNQVALRAIKSERYYYSLASQRIHHFMAEYGMAATIAKKKSAEATSSDGADAKDADNSQDEDESRDENTPKNADVTNEPPQDIVDDSDNSDEV